MVALPTDPVPSYGTDMSEEPRIRKVQYGDGYSQRSNDGLNAVRQRWTVVWAGIKRTEAETLRLFFKGEKGTGIITWTPFDQSEELKFTAGAFRSTPASANTTDCSVILTQEFDL